MKCGVESRWAFKIHSFGVIYPIAYGETVVPQGYMLFDDYGMLMRVTEGILRI